MAAEVQIFKHEKELLVDNLETQYKITDNKTHWYIDTYYRLSLLPNTYTDSGEVNTNTY